MFKKDFVAVYILPEVMYVISLSSDKKEVAVSAKLELPQGLIKNYKVVDTDVFAQVLTTLWKTYNLHERSVGIVLSEFAAYTKVIPIATTTVAEMHEAVLWAAQDFLPDDIDTMLLDWKIVKQKPKGNDVFVVAVHKNVVQSYTDSFEKAGLIPMYVEIPSLSLARLVKDPEKETLIVYEHPNASVVVFLYEGTLFASSVVHGDDPSEIITTVKKIVTHYKTSPPTKLFVNNKGKKVSNELENYLGITSQILEVPITMNLTSEFFVPLSLASTTLTEPSDPHTINLLPQAYVDKYHSSKEKVQFWGLILTVTLFVWISLFSALGTYLFISQSVTAITSSSATKTDLTQKRDQSVALVKEINRISESILNVKKFTIIPQEILNMVSMSVPAGVTITGYKMDFDLGEIRISGTAMSRVVLVEFKQNLEKNEKIGNVQIPISSFERETNLTFDLSAQYLPIVKSLPPEKNQTQPKVSEQPKAGGLQ